MASKAKPKAEAVKPRNAIEVLHDPDGNLSFDDSIAKTLTRPHVKAAATIQRIRKDHEVNALARELRAQVAAVNNGDLKRVEGMLISQAYTLDELFNNLANRAAGQEYLAQYETYLRLAFKAQGQCRATLETLAAIKNPPIVYARQANIANGPQQVNNGIPLCTRETKNLQNKQSGGDNELLPDTGTPALAGRIDPAVEAVGAINWAEVKSG